jgi:hypothetical protein
MSYSSYSMHKLRRAATMHPNGLSFLDSIKNDEKNIIDEDEDDKDEEDDKDHFISHSKFVCKCCKRSLVSKYALENHMTKCFMIKIENLTKQNELLKEVLDDARLTHAQQLEDLEKSHEHTIQFMIKYIETSDKKLLNLCQSTFEYMKVIATTDYTDDDGNIKDNTLKTHNNILSTIF